MATSRENKTISQFKSALVGGGARPKLFEVELTTFPTAAANADWDPNNFRFMCKAAQLPASTIANIDVPFRGRIFKVAGDRTVDTWTVTVIDRVVGPLGLCFLCRAKTAARPSRCGARPARRPTRVRGTSSPSSARPARRRRRATACRPT